MDLTSGASHSHLLSPALPASPALFPILCVLSGGRRVLQGDLRVASSSGQETFTLRGRVTVSLLPLCNTLDHSLRDKSEQRTNVATPLMGAFSPRAGCLFPSHHLPLLHVRCRSAGAESSDLEGCGRGMAAR